jgi:DNA helicase-2/ATP-dependent DNA helicase PcrA
VNSTETLNPDQQKIVEHQEGPALVIAGAGSGKTRVITHRVTRLIHSGVPASAIMLLTFTNKAANEMAERVAQANSLRQEQRMLHGTFHSMGSRFLRRYAPLLQYENNFSILDSSDSRDLLKASQVEVLGKPGRNFPKVAVLQDLFSGAFNRLCTIEMLLKTPYQERNFHLEQYVTGDYPYFEEHLEAMIEILRTYRLKKRRNQVMDFDDLLENWLELLLREGEGLPLVNQVQFVLVDEYQDTNQVQANILETLTRSHRNLMVVGDDAQSIYSWRGAEFQNILGFPERYSAAMYRMEENYRSTPEILELANASINHNQHQFEKNLFTRLTSGDKPTVHEVWSDREEALLVIERLLELQDHDLPLSAMAVLYRNHVQSATLQVELTRAGIPFLIHSGVKFFEQAHIKDLTAFLKVLFNPLDEIAWMRILKLLPGVGNTTAYRIFNVFQTQQAVRLTKENQELQKLIPSKARADWNTLLECFQEMLKEGIRPGQMLEILFQRFYRPILFSSFENAHQRENDVHYLREYAAGYQSLESFLSELSLVGTNLVTDHESSERENEDLLTLTTIHQAKGLEWEAVFVIGLTEGLFPHQRSMDTDAKLEEERRLFYVALTRAKHHLTISAPIVATTYTGPERFGRSRFVEELPPERVESISHKRSTYDSGTNGRTRFYF